MNANKTRKIILLLATIIWCTSPNLALASAISMADADKAETINAPAGDIDPLPSIGVSSDENPTPYSKPKYSVVSVANYTVTAYTSEAAQTDASPCITATGFNLCKNGVEDTIAANFLPMGTKVRMPDLYGDRIFTVRDRMNARFKNRVDIWFKNKNTAIKFGIKKVKIEVLDENK